MYIYNSSLFRSLSTLSLFLGRDLYLSQELAITLFGSDVHILCIGIVTNH